MKSSVLSVILSYTMSVAATFTPGTPGFAHETGLGPLSIVPRQSSGINVTIPLTYPSGADWHAGQLENITWDASSVSGNAKYTGKIFLTKAGTLPQGADAPFMSNFSLSSGAVEVTVPDVQTGSDYGWVLQAMAPPALFIVTSVGPQFTIVNSGGSTSSFIEGSTFVTGSTVAESSSTTATSSSGSTSGTVSITGSTTTSPPPSKSTTSSSAGSSSSSSSSGASSTPTNSANSLKLSRSVSFLVMCGFVAWSWMIFIG